MSKTLLFILVSVFAMEGAALAAKSPRAAKSSFSFEEASGGSSRGFRQEMLLDVSAHYVRGTKAEDPTDTAGRFSLGGMFTSWLGLDLQGLYEVKSKSYLVGTDIRLAPNEWFFFKVGVGGYADKATRALTFTPLAGSGIMARMTSDFYFVTEMSYFQINKHDNISFGAGLGASF